MSKCKKCGENMKVGRVYDYEVVSIKEVEGYCYTCYFWAKQAKLHKKEPDRRFVIEGQSYCVGPENAGALRGCGGREFTIKPDKGSVIITTNLWCQGHISEHFREELRDNAKFVYTEQPSKKIGGDDVPF